MVTSSLSGLNLVLTDTVKPAHTLSSTSLLTFEPRALAFSHARQTYGCGKHKGPFNSRGATTPPPTPSHPYLFDNVLPRGCVPSQEAFMVYMHCDVIRDV